MHLLIDRLQVNYVNPLLYPVSVSDFPSPERGAIGTLIGDLTSKSALLLFTILSASLNIENQHTISF